MAKHSGVLALPLRAKIPADFRCDIEVWPISRTNGPDGTLSPFFLGPCTTPDGIEFQNMENMWQYSKVYPHLGHVHTRGELAGLPNSKWFDWHHKGAESVVAHRYPAGKGAVPAYSLWNGQCLSYIVARKLVYIPEYAKLACRTPRFIELRREHARGANIVIRDFDVYSIWNTGTTLMEVFSRQQRAGHGFVLAAMLAHGPHFYRTLIA